MHQKINILLLEDDQDDVDFIRSILLQDGLSFDLLVVVSREQYHAALEQDAFDIIISDHQLPAFSSIEALRMRNEKNLETPFILVTGAVSDEYAAAMLREGAVDYILKDRLQRLPSAVRKAVERHHISLQKAAAEQALKKSNELFELASQASFDVIFDYDVAGKTIQFNDALKKNFGYSFQQLSPDEIVKYIYPKDISTFRKSFATVLKSSDIRWHAQFRAIRSDNSVAYVNSNALLIRGENNRVFRIVGVLQDVSQIINLQVELNQEKIRKQKELTDAIIQAQEKERDEIGKELHDNVNQLLATAKIMIDAAISTPDMHDELLRISQDSILSAIAEIRNISHDMIAPAMEEDQFVEAINNLIRTVNLSGTLHVTAVLPDTKQLQRINDKMKLTLYRIIQEQMANILKHAKAESATVTLSIKGNQLLLSITDNGIGFNPKKRTEGVGLKNIENRVEVFEGKMEIISRPDMGCKLKVSIPLAPKDEFIFPLKGKKLRPAGAQAPDHPRLFTDR